MIDKLVIGWIQWRYGNVAALKPPLGYHSQYAPRPMRWVLLYVIRKAFWRLECRLFNVYGQPMRDEWEKSAG